MPSRCSHPDVGLLELLEDPRLVGRRNARPGIGHRHMHLAVHSRGRHRDPPAGRRELDRIREDVEDDLANSPLVAADAVRVWRKLERELHAVLRRAFANHHDPTFERFPQREGRDVKFDLAGLDLRQIENVVDQGEQVVAGRKDVGEVLLLLFVDPAEHPLL